jgi:hypothetical protein
MGGEFYCQRNGVGLLDNEVVVTYRGTLESVIIYVRSGHDTSLSHPAPAGRMVLAQDRCVYVPRVLTLMTGQELLVRN